MERLTFLQDHDGSGKIPGITPFDSVFSEGRSISGFGKAFAEFPFSWRENDGIDRGRGFPKGVEDDDTRLGIRSTPDDGLPASGMLVARALLAVAHSGGLCDEWHKFITQSNRPLGQRPL